MANLSEEQQSYLTAFLESYIECALWSSLFYEGAYEGQGLDAVYDTDDLDDAARKSCQEDCEGFISMAWDDLVLAREKHRRGPSDCGHDFWLTRNGHGAGFWDRGMGALGDRLTKHAKTYGGVDLYATGEEGSKVSL